MATKLRTYVLTGSNSEIGQATKRLLESQGLRVIGIDSRQADIVADLSTHSGRELMVNSVTQVSGGAIDAVLALEGTTDGGSASVALNFYGTIATLQGLRPLLVQSNSPRAVALSSITSIHPFDYVLLHDMLDGSEDRALSRAAAEQLTYATSKRALSRWIRRVACNMDWAGSGIPLNGIAPGLLKTHTPDVCAFTREGMQAMHAGVPMPLGGPLEPRDVAQLLAWFTSPENGHITGQVIFIDGGAEVSLRGEAVF
jgi:NAD(P)-dependent dehydrogenase (short-subunit alcohol dehydrogenase family)